MDRFDRIYRLDRILRQARLPVSRKALQEKLECSRPTLCRIIEDMRDYLGAPLEYDRKRNGYYYAKTGEHPYELPGLWFNASELHALLSVQQLLGSVQPGLLDQHLAPLRKRIEEMLSSRALGKGDVTRCVRILPMAARSASEYFQAIAGALMQRRQVHLRYHARGRDEITERTVSPQRLVHYRDNWYLDAWCHLRNELRSFSVDRVRACRTLDDPADDIAEERLNDHYAAAYGIFAGKPKHTAVLRFTPKRARWVADEQWHPAQEGHFLPDGSYKLSLPYSDPRELIMDILKYGPEVEVMAPSALRDEVRGRLSKAVSLYGKKEP